MIQIILKKKWKVTSNTIFIIRRKIVKTPYINEQDFANIRDYKL